MPLKEVCCNELPFGIIYAAMMMVALDHDGSATSHSKLII
jgi:hypothetical protein